MKPILLIGEAYGANEARINAAFVGSSGIELLRMLGDSGVITLTSEDLAFIRQFYDRGDPYLIDAVWQMHPEVARNNVLSFHPPGNDLDSVCGPRAEGIPGFPAFHKTRYLRAEFAPELDRLADEILALDPNLIVALGNSPLWALCGTTGITKLRGTTMLSTRTIEGYKVLPTFHPSAVLRQWGLRPTVVADLSKALREKDFPDIRRPRREIWIEPDINHIQEFIGRFIKSPTRVCDLLSVDIETAADQITEIGLAPSADRAIVIPFYDKRKKSRSYWPVPEREILALKLIAGVLSDPTIPKLFQNGLYDIAFIWRTWGIATLGAKEDTMLKHHALQPESLKGLGYLGSIYVDEGPWKSMRKHHTTIKRDE